MMGLGRIRMHGEQDAHHILNRFIKPGFGRPETFGNRHEWKNRAARQSFPDRTGRNHQTYVPVVPIKPTEAIISRVARPDLGDLSVHADSDWSRKFNQPTRYEFLDKAMTTKLHWKRVIWGCLCTLASAGSGVLGSTEGFAAGPVRQADFEPDYEASGFVAPAGMPSPEAYYAAVERAGFFGQSPIASRLGATPSNPGAYCDAVPGCGCGHSHGGYAPPAAYGTHSYPGAFGGLAPAGAYGAYPHEAAYGMPSAPCGDASGYGVGMEGYIDPTTGAYVDPSMGCQGCPSCSCGQPGCGTSIFDRGPHGGGIGRGGLLGRLSRACLFCSGVGCGICKNVIGNYVLGTIGMLRPYGEAGIAAQRWYDLSAELMFLGVSGGTSGGGVVTTQGIAGTPVLYAYSGDSDGLEVGGRLSAAFIAGPGGNIEVTYMGGNEWEGAASVEDPNFGLYSFLSEFGTDPVNGFDDTDRSEFQSVSTASTFHSGEVNYRRRTVGPFGRFQGSWLGGIRYLRFDSNFDYFARGALDNSTNLSRRFFELDSGLKNEMVGVQIGGDVWWNVIPGMNVGLGLKGGPMGNSMKRNATAYANSLGPGATPGVVSIADRRDDSTWMGELETTLLYRVSHSWTFKTSYFLLGVDDVGYGFDTTAADVLINNARINPIRTQSLTIEGVTWGAEYIW